MPIFLYKARDRFGVPVEGSIESASSLGVASRLTRLGYTPIMIVEKQASFLANMGDWFAGFQKMKTEELVVFARQLATILEAGVPLLESLEALLEQVQSRRFKLLVLKMRKEIEGGSSFSEALARESKVFSIVFIAMVRAGEKAGILSEVLDRLANLLEKDFENVQKIKAATRYPAIVLITLVVGFLIVVTFVIPRFAALYAQFKTQLPLPTRILLGINFVIRNYFIYIIMIIAALGYGWKKILETEKGRYAWDRFILSVPVFGVLVNKLILARFARMLAAMLHAGIPIIEALRISGETVDNKIIAKVVDHIREEVNKGVGLAEPMRGTRVFPPLVVQMVAIGEKAGALESMLNKVADYFDRDADYMIKNLTPILEPLLILGLALLVALLALGVYLPMWDMVKLVKIS